MAHTNTTEGSPHEASQTGKVSLLGLDPPRGVPGWRGLRKLGRSVKIPHILEEFTEHVQGYKRFRVFLIQ